MSKSLVDNQNGKKVKVLRNGMDDNYVENDLTSSIEVGYSLTKQNSIHPSMGRSS